MFFLFQLLLISYFLTPRLFGGLRLDDLLLFLVPVFFIGGYRMVMLPKHPVAIAYALFLLLTLVFFAYGTSMRGEVFEGAVVSLGKVVTYFFAYVLAYNVAARWPQRAGTLLRLVFFLASLNALWFFYQIATGNFVTLIGEDDASSYGVKMIAEGAAYQVAGVIALLSVLVLIIARFVVAWKKLLFLFGYAFLMLSLFYTQSRVNLGAAIIAGYLVGAFYFGRIIIFHYAILVMSLLFLTYGLDTVDALVDYSVRLSVDGVLSALELRASFIWADVLNGIDAYPLLGQGVGAFSLVAESGEVHNYYLKLLYEGGIGYFAVFLAFIYFVFKTTVPISVDESKRALDFWVISSAIILCVGGLVQDAFSSSKVMIGFMTILGYSNGFRGLAVSAAQREVGVYR